MTHPLPSMRKIKKFAGKRVLVRVDFNVPMKGKKIIDDSRIKASLPTIQHLLSHKAKIILVTHLGRPDGKPDPSLRLDPVATRLSKLLGVRVKKLPQTNGPRVRAAIDAMQPGDVTMLENMRFSVEEKDEKGPLAQELASYADLFVLDGFAVAHRSAASVSGIPQHIPGYAGLLLEQEIKGLNKLLQKPRVPFVVILGGAKMETKVPVLKNLLPRSTFVLVGGGIVNTYLQARGYDIGKSLYESKCLKEALRYCRSKKTVLPVDVVVGTPDGKKVRVVMLGKKPHAICKKGEAIFDIGPETIRRYADYIKKAKTLVWNGAMGYFEQKPYDVGTTAIARLVASRSKGRAYGVVGGGETVQLLEMIQMQDTVDLVSTGGGAMLEYLSGKKLPGIEALGGKRK